MNKINQLQGMLSELPQVEPPVVNHFSEGIYMREITIKEGTVVIGKTHKTEHLNVISQGECRVAMNGETATLRAPYTFISPKGAKKAILALSDTVWSTIHPTDETDIDKLEELIIDTKAEDEIALDYKEMLCLGQQ